MSPKDANCIPRHCYRRNVYGSISENVLLLFATGPCTCVLKSEASLLFQQLLGLCLQYSVCPGETESVSPAVRTCSAQRHRARFLVSCSYTVFCSPDWALGFPRPFIIFCLMHQTKLCHYSNFFTEPCGRTCLTFLFVCWKVFVPCRHLKLNRACNAMPRVTALRDRSYSCCPRAALSRSISFSGRQKGQKQWQELWLPLWWLQRVAGGRIHRL